MLLKNLSLYLSLFTVLLSYAQEHKTNSALVNASRFVLAIENENYAVVEQYLENSLIPVNMYYKGKTFIIHASISNKPEMVQLLYRYGADITLPCDEGFSPEEHAKANDAIHALAEIIVIKA